MQPVVTLSSSDVTFFSAYATPIGDVALVTTASNLFLVRLNGGSAAAVRTLPLPQPGSRSAVVCGSRLVSVHRNKVSLREVESGNTVATLSLGENDEPLAWPQAYVYLQVLGANLVGGLVGQNTELRFFTLDVQSGNMVRYALPLGAGQEVHTTPLWIWGGTAIILSFGYELRCYSLTTKTCYSSTPLGPSSQQQVRAGLVMPVCSHTVQALYRHNDVLFTVGVYRLTCWEARIPQR